MASFLMCGNLASIFSRLIFIFFIKSIFLNSLTVFLKSPFGKSGTASYLPVSIPCLIGEKKHTPRLFIFT